MGEQLVISQTIDQRTSPLVVEGHNTIAIESTTGHRFLAQPVNLLAVANFQLHHLATVISIAPGDVLLALTLPSYKGRIRTGLPVPSPSEQ